MEAFVETTLQLIAQERDTETLQSQEIISTQLGCPAKLESQGICLSRLQVASESIGLYGRHVIAFEQCFAGRKPLPSTSITSGDIVGVFTHGKPVSEKGLSGIVVAKEHHSLSVAFDQLDDTVNLSTHNGALLVVKLSNDVTYRRMKGALDDLRSGKGAYHLVRALFEENELRSPDIKLAAILSSTTELDKFPFFNVSLDDSQRRAVLFALSRPDVAVIHGPPGTGKTTTVVELILQAVKLGIKVLACAPSNIAVDNLVERLAQAKAKVVRVGHPARLSESIQQYSLDALLHRVDSAEIIMDVRKDIKKALTSLQHCKGAGERGKWRGEIKVLKKELQTREKRAIRELLRGADVILATTTGASPDGPLKHLPEDHFGLTVIDECAQAVEAGCWIPLLWSSKCVLAGDHKQLPPTILSQQAAENGLSLSVMERVTRLHGDKVTAMLTVQYRMNEHIMTPSSKFFYESKLVAHSTVIHHTLSCIEGVASDPLTSEPLLLIDTLGCHMTELDTDSEESKGNEGEADLVVHHLKALLNVGMTPSQVAIIAPYSLQVELIRKRLVSIDGPMSAVEVHTVDGFQGREKEAVIISFTRSNKKGEYGFLSESRRTNVAVTRARRHLALIGDSSTVSHEPFVKVLLEYCHEYGQVYSAQDYVNDPGFESCSYYESTTTSKVKQQSTGSTAAKKVANTNKKQNKPPKTQERFQVGQSSELTTKNKQVEQDTDTFEVQLGEFVSGQDDVLTFSTSLTSNERRIIHEICERMGLLHVSKGDGSERFIEVQKKKHSEASIAGEFCAKAEGACGLSLAEDPPPVRTPSVNQPPHSEIIAKKPKKQAPKKKVKATESPQEDLDTLLSEMQQLDSTCAQSKCKKSVKLVSVKCSWCSRRYCMEHSLPEVHGCGEAAKRGAHTVKPSRGGAAVASRDREKLQKKLHDKIEKMTSKKDKSRKR